MLLSSSRYLSALFGCICVLVLPCFFLSGCASAGIVDVLVTSPSPPPSTIKHSRIEPDDPAAGCRHATTTTTRARAWVRAPDAEPGRVLRGDVRVRLFDEVIGDDAPRCLSEGEGGRGEKVDRFELGLRLRERIFLKLRRPEYALPTRPGFTRTVYKNQTNNSTGAFGGLSRQRGLFDVFEPMLGRPIDEDVWMAYERAVKQEEAWAVHEEESVVFETRVDLDGVYEQGKGRNGKPQRTWTTSFGLLVPWTNYPFGLDYRPLSKSVLDGSSNVINVDHRYEYFVNVHFHNGTVLHVPAGVTAFHPLLPPSPPEISSNTSYHVVFGKPRHVERKDRLLSNYSADVSFPPDTRFVQGQIYNASVIMTRTGSTNRTDLPTRLCVTYEPHRVPRHPEFNFDTYTFDSIRFLVRYMRPSPPPPPAAAPGDEEEAEEARRRRQDFYSSRAKRACVSVAFPVDGSVESESNTTTTTSDPIPIAIHIPEHALIDFTTSYQTLGTRLRFSMSVSCDERDEDEQPVFGSVNKKDEKEDNFDEDEEDEDEDWIPWFPNRRPQVPLGLVRHLEGTLDISVSTLTTTEHRTRPCSPPRVVPVPIGGPTHYLSPSARTPLLIHASRVRALAALPLEQLDALAPLSSSDGAVNVVRRGEEAVERYPEVVSPDEWRASRLASGRRWSHPRSGGVDEGVVYVGDTWVRKVLHRAGGGSGEDEDIFGTRRKECGGRELVVQQS